MVLIQKWYKLIIFIIALDVLDMYALDMIMRRIKL